VDQEQQELETILETMILYRGFKALNALGILHLSLSDQAAATAANHQYTTDLQALGRAYLEYGQLRASTPWNSQDLEEAQEAFKNAATYAPGIKTRKISTLPDPFLPAPYSQLYPVMIMFSPQANKAADEYLEKIEKKEQDSLAQPVSNAHRSAHIN
jgi:hypothetical protein